MSQTQFQDIDQSCQMEIWKEENEENGQSNLENYCYTYFILFMQP
jgi:hypothetical protein